MSSLGGEYRDTFLTTKTCNRGTTMKKMKTVWTALLLLVSLILLASCIILPPQDAQVVRVTFDSQGATVEADPATKYVEVGSVGALPTEPIKTNYTFGGWWTASNGGGTEFKATNFVTRDITVYAKWVGAPQTKAPEKQIGTETVIIEQVAAKPAEKVPAQIEYKVGVPGPAGGYVFFDKGAYNTEFGSWDGTKWTKEGDGSLSWRYLEAAPADLKIGDNELFPFGYYRPERSNLVVGTETAIGTGKANTVALMNAKGNAYRYQDTTNETMTSEYAAKLCDDFKLDKFDDWFLPAHDELNLMYFTLYRNDIGDFTGDYYWSSSEFDGEGAWVQLFQHEYRSPHWRFTEHRVRPIRAF